MCSGADIAAPSPADLRPGLTADSFAHSLKQSSYRNVDIRDLGLSSSESAGGDQSGCAVGRPIGTVACGLPVASLLSWQ